MKKEDIIKKHPSICYGCEYARRSASAENENKGYVGCSKYTETNSYDFVKEAKELAQGWVDLRSNPFTKKGSGIITNYQLLTLGVKMCSSFKISLPYKS